MHRTRPRAATRAGQRECNLDGNLVLPDLHSRALDAAQEAVEAVPGGTFPAGSVKGSKTPLPFTTKSSKPNILKVLLPQVVLSWLAKTVTVSLARCGSNSVPDGARYRHRPGPVPRWWSKMPLSTVASRYPILGYVPIQNGKRRRLHGQSLLAPFRCLSFP